MNAVTQTEAQAVNAAASSAANALQAADPSKHMILVPLSRLVLRPTGRNVRKTPRMSIPELAASIQRVGLLQNLIVIPAADGLHYEVVAGGRRLAALKLLAKKHRIAKDWNVPCLQVADGTARTASLTENVQREAMHPADQFEAFAALVAEGRPIEDIAADFSVTPLVVQRRLKLANVSPRLMADYRAEAVSLDQLMALALTDDHAAQESAFYDAPTWQRQPSALRKRLTEREIDAYRHPLVRFVGLDAYEQAGGGIRRDLFAEDDAGVYLTDAALLERLAQNKLAGIAAEVKAEGWAWADATPGMTHADLHAFQRAPRERRDPSKREAQRIEKLQAKMQEVAEAIDAATDADDEDKADALQEEGERLGEQLQALEDGLQGYGANVKAAAGAIVTIGRNGEVVIHRGLLREAEAKALRTLEKLRQGFSDPDAANDDEGEDDEPPKAAAISDRLAQRLSAHRTAALQIEVARHPQVALAALVHGMVQTVLQGRYYGHDIPLGVSLKVQDRLEGMAPDWPQSPAAVALRELQETWGGKLPEDKRGLPAPCKTGCAARLSGRALCRLWSNGPIRLRVHTTSRLRCCALRLPPGESLGLSPPRGAWRPSIPPNRQRRIGQGQRPAAMDGAGEHAGACCGELCICVPSSTLAVLAHHVTKDGSRTSRPALPWSFHATPQDRRRKVRPRRSRLSSGG